MIWNWLRRKLWLLSFENALDEIEALRLRTEYLERWIKALDEALWRVDLTVQAVGSAAAPSAPAAPPPPDFRALAQQIKEQMSAHRKPFPTRVEDDAKA